MINEEYKAMLGGKSVIRELSEYATSRGAEIGYQNVFDYSLGNPSVPAPKSFTDAMVDLYENGDPVAIHGYSPSLGIPSVKDAIAENLNERFGMAYTGNHIFPTTGAAGALSHAMRAVTKPGDEIITFAPYFPEYQPYVKGAGAKLTIVPADTENFQINFDAFEAALNPNVQVVLINTPNNPSGAVYSADTLKRLAAFLTAKQVEYGHDIFLISDEPYREIVFDGATQPYPASFYANSLTCYSWSKSLSLPGERIGYLLVPDTMPDFDHVYKAMCGAGRSLGYICDSVLFQLAVAECVDAPIDIEPYDRNRKILYDGLKEIGYNVIYPQGAFYMWIEALEPDAQAFCETCRQHELLLVPSDGFLTKGWTRVGYCCDEATIRGALGAFREVYDEYQ